MQSRPGFSKPMLALGLGLITLSACDGSFDMDLRRFGDGFSTTSAAQTAQTAARPAPDARGVISYPNYQIAVARKGDTASSVAARLGLDAGELASYNGIPADASLREGEVIALPRRVAGGSTVDITSLAGDALERADGAAAVTTTELASAGTEPVRHKVQRGETAYSIARQYNVSVRALAEWNGLDSALSVREGQYLIIPVKLAEAPAEATTEPGTGSATPLPPSSAAPLPEEDAVPLSQQPEPETPDLGADRTAASSAAMVMPVDGKIIRAFVKGKTDGIDISASAGSPVRAAADGTVAAITKDTDQVPILVLRHANNLLTVYANIDGLTVKKGDSVSRGQVIAQVRESDPAFLHFQVREGTVSVDPADYLD